MQCFVFGGQWEGGSGVHSLAFLAPAAQRDWLLQRQPFLAAFLADAVAGFRAALAVEGEAEVTTRMTSALGHLVSLLGEVELRPLPPPSLWRTAFGGESELEPGFLLKAAAATLLTKARILLTGDVRRARHVRQPPPLTRAPAQPPFFRWQRRWHSSFRTASDGPASDRCAARAASTRPSSASSTFPRYARLSLTAVHLRSENGM